jgi:hypothetical protein
VVLEFAVVVGLSVVFGLASVVGLAFVVGLFVVVALGNVTPPSAHAPQPLATFWQHMSLTQEFRQFAVFRQPVRKSE